MIPDGSDPSSPACVNPQRSRALPGSSRRLPPGSFTIQERRAEVTIPSAQTPIRLRNGPRAPAGSLSKSAPRPGVNRPGMAEDGELESQRFQRPAAFQAVPAPWLVHPPRAEGGALEAHGVTRASASNGARCACPVHLPYPPRDSNPDVILLRDAALPVGLEGHASDRPDSNRPPDLGKVRC